MALNLSTLTNASTSATVLAEAQTTADFLDSVPILKNIARGSNKGGDGKQTTALNQPKALPYDGKGYLYLSGVTGNHASVPDPLGALDDFTFQVDGLDAGAVRPAATGTLMSQHTGASTASFILRIQAAGTLYLNLYTTSNEVHSSIAVPADTVGIRITRVGTLITYWVDTGSGYVSHDTDTSVGTVLTNPTVPLEIGVYSSTDSPLTGKISRAVIWDNGTQAGDPVLDVDFTATNIRHNDTKFKCATGQTVTINQAGNDPATVIKKSVLRFDGVNDGLQGLFANNIDGGYMFAAFSVLGSGGESWARVFTTSLAGSGNDYSGAGAGFAFRNSATTGLYTLASGLAQIQTGMFDDANGDILYEVKLKNSEFTAKLNNAGFLSATHDGTIDSDQFNIGQDFVSTQNGAIDLEYLALFPATITAAEAARVVNYINNRNNVFDLKDSLGYYFYDGAKSPVGNITDVATWNGRIVGSDNGDADKLAAQATSADQPAGDGYKVTFADNTDFLTIPSTAQAGWQVVGTSLGTFAYKVNANAVTELNLLGNLGTASYRQAGDLYGIILLPETATGADIEAARKLLIDRGAADGTTSSSIWTYWYGRNDLVEFKGVNTENVTSSAYAWKHCTALTSFPAIDMSSGANFTQTWYNNLALTSFPALDMSSGTSFAGAWQSCTALTSFPAGAKLGTEAANVNFTSAWQASGLTSFSTPLPTGGIFVNSWFNCPSLIKFNTDLPLATIVYQAWFGCSGLTDFNTDLSLVADAAYAWYSCPSLSSFDTLLPSVSRMTYAWYSNTSLTDFSADVFSTWNPASISNAVFNGAWANCTALTAQSVENILVSINASGKHATSTGASGGAALADAGIDIDYNTVGGTSPLSAATNTAIDSLSGKGWEVFINGVLVIPNILDLAPAAAYSLRSFDSAADPDVVNVRRSSDSATSDFKASEVSDGTLTTWVGSGNDGHVTTWYDQGGTNHAAQATASSQPKIVDGGVLVTDGSGNPAIIGDGVDDTLVHPTLTNELDSSDFLVTAAYKDEVAMGIVGAVPRLYLSQSSMSYYTLGTIAYTSQTDRNVVSFQVLGNTQEVFGNGASLGTASQTQVDIGQNMFNVLQAGSSFSAKPLMEVVVFGNNQSTNRTGIEKNINDTYTIY